MRPINPDGLRRWASTVEQRLNSGIEAQIARSMHLARRHIDARLRQKCLADIALIDSGGWKPTDTPCSCPWGEHNLIEVSGTLMCPIDMYLRLGRLALWGYRALPTPSLYWALLNKEEPK